MDVENIRVVINIGIPKCDWELKQQSGRAGRDGRQAVCINTAPKSRISKPGEHIENGIFFIILSYLTNNE